ncbi:ribosome maturation factor RimP [Microlunatus antarcticus]|uniref:Ribosome maturation factor RimP n=1 Tax=Microlunatus antarcticus TaxID=53388 RepID=A0A7W5P663_9ACTN|nr:ribosome maturation factor RimP [Microlunatus antarcticus]MBB3326123.1 ribosome maturation factor RimP [Microlunatus antarcticus]
MRDAAIEAVVSPVLESFGLELDALEVVPAGKRRVVRIVVDGDGPKGRGPLLDDIASASRAVSEALDTSDATGQAAYTLEVSSRGVGRPLTAPKHWRRNATRLVRVDLLDGSQLTGRITEAGEDAVELDVDGAARRLRYDEITKALVQVELNRRQSDDDEDDDELEIDDDEDEDS